VDKAFNGELRSGTPAPPEPSGTSVTDAAALPQVAGAELALVVLSCQLTCGPRFWCRPRIDRGVSWRVLVTNARPTTFLTGGKYLEILWIAVARRSA
jgi:hypothetical protein